MKRNDRKGPRPGFTLIELLVVIAIIAVLVSLTAAVVLKVLGRGPELKRRSDISQLQSDIDSFKAKFGVDYMPSRFALRLDITTYTNDPLEKDSKFFLQKMFGDRVGLKTNPDGSTSPIPLAWAGYDSSNNLIPFAQPTILTGDQCLVFFLGGMTYGSPPTCQGFSSDKRNPTRTDKDFIAPFYNFESKRLAPGGNGFYSYKDPYGTPYAYFSSYKRTNGYNRYTDSGGNPTSDCGNLLGQFPSSAASASVWPYYSASGKYYNPTSFQIISAGKDGKFGCTNVSSTPWSPGSGSGVIEDDMSNFHDSVLGVK